MKNIALVFLIINFGIMSSCNSQDNSKKIYLGGWEAEFNGDEECQKFMHTQVVDKTTARNLWSAIELVFENDKLVKAYDYDEGMKQDRELNENEMKLKFIELEPNQLYEIDESDKGHSYLGGESPGDFKTPKFDFVAPFQYLGMLSNKDEAFNWLPFDLHLVAPIYLNFSSIMLDYSNPNAPAVINVEELRETDNSYEDELKADSEIVFERMSIATKKVNDYGSGFGHSGIPNWIQYPDIPTCPKSGKTMKFLLQLSSDTGVQTKRTNVTSDDDWMLKYFQHLNFWGDGDLYIFFEPDSRVICFIIQNT